MNIPDSDRPRIRRIRHRRNEGGPEIEQGDLFRRKAVVRELLPGLSPFQRALLLDERGSEKAVAAYESAIRVGDSVTESYCNLAVLRYDEGDRDAAIDLLTRALEYDVTNVDVHFNLGNIYQDAGWLRPAEVEYRLVLAYDPEFISAYYNLGLVCAQQKRVSEAKAALERYIELSPDQEAAKATGLLELLRQLPASRQM